MPDDLQFGWAANENYANPFPQKKDNGFALKCSRGLQHHLQVIVSRVTHDC